MKHFKNIKTGNIYAFVGDAINTTNKDDGKEMIIYTDFKHTFVREIDEFNQNFVPIVWKSRQKI